MDFIIGKEGNQPFEITTPCVSRRHAMISVSDDGKWVLEDLDSRNGTFIQNDDGDFVEIKKAQINEYTRIALGSTSATGYYFYAHHVLEPEGRYESEMRHVINTYEELTTQRDMLTAKNNKKKWIRRTVPVLFGAVFVAILYIFFKQYIVLNSVIGSFIAAIGLFADSYLEKESEEIKEIQQKLSKLVRCPKCNRPLNPVDIAGEMCPACKTHS